MTLSRIPQVRRAPADDAGDVKSARRVMEIIQLLGSTMDGLTFSTIASKLGVAKSSLHGLLATMTRGGWVTFDPHTRAYRIGPRVWEAGQAFPLANRLGMAASPHLRALCAEINQTVQVAILDDVEVLYIVRIEADQPYRELSRAGSRLPAWASGLGKVLLASLSLDELRSRMYGVEMPAFTPHSITSMQELEDALHVVRRTGLGRDVHELNMQVRCVAAPVLDQNGDVIAAVSTSIDEMFGEPQLSEAETIPRLIATAEAISREMGWRSISESVRP